MNSDRSEFGVSEVQPNFERDALRDLALKAGASYWISPTRAVWEFGMDGGLERFAALVRAEALEEFAALVKQHLRDREPAFTDSAPWPDTEGGCSCLETIDFEKLLAEIDVFGAAIRAAQGAKP